MLRYVISGIRSRTDHPFILTLFILAAAFAVSAVVVEVITGNGVASGFLLIYAMLSTLLGVVAYLALYTLKYASILRDRALLS